MRVAVIGGTGLVGRHTVAALGRAGHDPVVVARSTGVDVTTGSGLDEALSGVSSVIDVTSTATVPSAAFFEAATTHLLAAERRAAVRHHVLLSIVCLDRVDGNDHYAGKLHQERLVEDSGIPHSILRATQFHEFAEQVVGWSRNGDTAVVPPLLVQPVAVADVAAELAAIAVGEPRGRAQDLAGPETQDLVDMARRTLAARGETLRLIPSWRGPLGVGMAGEVLLPGADAKLAPTTFDAWLERVRTA